MGVLVQCELGGADVKLSSLGCVLADPAVTLGGLGFLDGEVIYAGNPPPDPWRQKWIEEMSSIKQNPCVVPPNPPRSMHPAWRCHPLCPLPRLLTLLPSPAPQPRAAPWHLCPSPPATPIPRSPTIPPRPATPSYQLSIYKQNHPPLATAVERDDIDAFSQIVADSERSKRKRQADERVHRM